MKKVIFMMLISNLVFAANLEDVQILNVMPGKENFKLKLHAKDGPGDSYFFLDILKSDPESFDKLMHVISKMMYKNKYKLDLNIPSFSLLPSGSYYRSDDITFSGTANRQPSSTKKRKNK